MEDPFPLFLLALELLPTALDRAGSGELRVTEDVRVPAHELGVDPSSDPRQVARAPLLEEEREKHRLEEQVPQLVGELAVVAGLGRVGDLVCLLDRVGDDRPLGLGAVPRAVAAEPLGELLQVDERPFRAPRRRPRSYSGCVSVAPVVVSASGGGSKPGA